MVVKKVIQRDHQVLLPGDKERVLFTENIGPCTGVGGTDGKGAGFLWHCDMPYASLPKIKKRLAEEGVDFSKLDIRVYSNGWGWFFPIWSLFVKLPIYVQLWRCGISFCNLPRPRVSSWSATGRIGLRVNVDTGTIAPTEVHYNWVDKDDWDVAPERRWTLRNLLKYLRRKKPG